MSRTPSRLPMAARRPARRRRLARPRAAWPRPAIPTARQGVSSRDSLVKPAQKIMRSHLSWRSVSVSLVRQASSCPPSRPDRRSLANRWRVHNVRQVDEDVPFVAALSGIAKSPSMKSLWAGPAMSAETPHAAASPASISRPGLLTTDVVFAVFWTVDCSLAEWHRRDVMRASSPGRWSRVARDGAGRDGRDRMRRAGELPRLMAVLMASIRVPHPGRGPPSGGPRAWHHDGSAPGAGLLPARAPHPGGDEGKPRLPQGSSSRALRGWVA